jgi:hypothetical protein
MKKGARKGEKGGPGGGVLFSALNNRVLKKRTRSIIKQPFNRQEKNDPDKILNKNQVSK